MTIGAARQATAMTSSYGYGYIRDLPDHRDYIYNEEFALTRTTELPLKVGRTLPYPALNQGELGACTAHGTAGAKLAEQGLQKLPIVTPSRLFIYYQERAREGTLNEGDTGAQVRDGIKVLANGTPDEKYWAYDIAKFQDKPPAAAYENRDEKALQYHRVILDNKLQAIRSALVERPVVLGFSVPERFEDPSWNPTTTPLPTPTDAEGFVGGHCVLAYDFDWTLSTFSIPVVKIRNSWSPEWGDQGDFWFDARWFLPSVGLVSDLWVVSTLANA